MSTIFPGERVRLTLPPETIRHLTDGAATGTVYRCGEDRHGSWVDLVMDAPAGTSQRRCIVGESAVERIKNGE